MVLADSHGVSRVPWYLGRDPKEPNRFRLRGHYPLWRSFPDPSVDGLVSDSPTPARRGPDRSHDTGHATLARLAHDRFRLFPFRSPLLRESRLLSLPPGTEMVHFPGFARTRLWIQRAVPDVDIGRVSPFGDPRINACLRLPGAYRSLPRPSSPACAKASTVRP